MGKHLRGKKVVVSVCACVRACMCVILLCYNYVHRSTVDYLFSSGTVYLILVISSRPVIGTN